MSISPRSRRCQHGPQLVKGGVGDPHGEGGGRCCRICCRRRRRSGINGLLDRDAVIVQRRQQRWLVGNLRWRRRYYSGQGNEHSPERVRGGGGGGRGRRRFSSSSSRRKAVSIDVNAKDRLHHRIRRHPVDPNTVKDPPRCNAQDHHEQRHQTREAGRCRPQETDQLGPLPRQNEEWHD